MLTYVFEDFIFGFIDKELEEVHAKSQSTSKYLDQNENFTLCPDLYLEIDSRKIIADSKYKIVYADEQDPKNGISQSDLYQMLAYAVRFKINEIKLFYPDTIKQYHKRENEIIIKDELAQGVDVNIKTYQLPIINRELYREPNIEEMTLSRIFCETRSQLIKRLKEIIFRL